MKLMNVRISENYSLDKEMLNHCKKYPSNKECACIVPDSKVIEAGQNFPTPYFCWYKPCLDNDVLITSIIKEEQKNCNIVNCLIELGDIVVNNGIVNILNDCGRATIFHNEQYDKFYKTYTKDIPDMFTSNYSIIIFCILFLSIFLLF